MTLTYDHNFKLLYKDENFKSCFLSFEIRILDIRIEKVI